MSDEEKKRKALEDNKSAIYSLFEHYAD